MITHTHLSEVQTKASTVRNSVVVSANAGVSMEVVVPLNDETEFAVGIPVVSGTVKSIHMSCSSPDVNLLVKTNSDGAPDDTIQLNGDAPYVWTENSVDALALTADVVSLFITNGSQTVSPTFKLEVAFDP